MAITAEQTAAIATAIENLNKSVQVNEEVLQIVKSMVDGCCRECGGARSRP